MGGYGALKAIVAAAGLAVAVAATPAHAITMVPGGATNEISLNDIFVSDIGLLNIGDWGGTGPDLVFKFQAVEKLVALTTQSLNPPEGSISNLTFQWNDAADGSGTVLSGPMDVTDAAGNSLSPGPLSLAFLSPGQVAYLLVSANGVLKNLTAFNLRVEAVPVPPALLLFGSGLIGVGLLARRRRRRETNSA